jgi:hypothetical protein
VIQLRVGGHDAFNGDVADTGGDRTGKTPELIPDVG